MAEPEQMPLDPTNPFVEASMEMHVLFMSLQGGGFTPAEALAIVGTVLSNIILSGSTGEDG